METEDHPHLQKNEGEGKGIRPQFRFWLEEKSRTCDRMEGTGLLTVLVCPRLDETI